MRRELSYSEMVRLYQNGLTLHEVAHEVGCHFTTVHYRLRQLGVKMRRCGQRPVETLIRQRQAPQLDHDEIARETGVPAETVATVASAVVERLMGRR